MKTGPGCRAQPGPFYCSAQGRRARRSGASALAVTLVVSQPKPVLRSAWGRARNLWPDWNCEAAGSKRLASRFLRTAAGSQMRPFMAIRTPSAADCTAPTAQPMLNTASEPWKRAGLSAPVSTITLSGIPASLRADRRSLRLFRRWGCSEVPEARCLGAPQVQWSAVVSLRSSQTGGEGNLASTPCRRSDVCLRVLASLLQRCRTSQ